MIPEHIREQARYELARRNFFSYCKLKAPDFYIVDRTYLKDMCDRLQEFIEDDDKKILVINVPPRHGKSRTATLLTQWLLGNNNRLKIMTGSYNEDVSSSFSKQVRDAISEEDGIFGKIFADTKIKYGESQIKKWALDGNQEANYLATSPTGTATGFGCNIMIIDDLIKNAEEAYNEMTLEKQWTWFTDTMLSRTETGFKIIIIMTRWASKDLAGRILDNYDNVTHINYIAVQEDGSMLCEDILSKEDFLFKTKEMNDDIVQANYNQTPIDLKGKLYKEFKEYQILPSFIKKYNQTDTADTGSDFLCSIDYVTNNGNVYITDLVFTDDSMEVTEELVANMLFTDGVNESVIESNNGGRGFARNVERIIKEKYNNNRTIIKSVPQTKNKEARILTASSWVNEHVYMPFNWKNKYPEFYRQVNSYMKKGKNKHDDAPDVLSSIYEAMTNNNKASFGYTRPV
jgi:predicted phage terminase large subunit-like protein